MKVMRLVVPAAFCVILAGGPTSADGPSDGLSDPVVVPASAATAQPAAPRVRPRFGLGLTLRGGLAVSPDYFGSDSFQLGPDVGVTFHYMRLGERVFGSEDFDAEKQGFGLRGAFRFVEDRDSADFPELAGLDDVDTSVEAGLGLGYYGRRFNAFADVRYGVIGHESFVVEVGADGVFRIGEDWRFTAGPRALWGDHDYVDTYFGVSPAEAAASGGRFGAFEADSGLVSAGIEIGATYRINDRWGVEGAVTWDRLVGDAGDSPITAQGDEDQFGLRIGVTRSVTLNF